MDASVFAAVASAEINVRVGVYVGSCHVYMYYNIFVVMFCRLRWVGGCMIL